MTEGFNKLRQSILDNEVILSDARRCLETSHGGIMTVVGLGFKQPVLQEKATETLIEILDHENRMFESIENLMLQTNKALEDLMSVIEDGVK